MVKTPLADPQRTGRGLPVFILVIAVLVAGRAGASFVAGSSLMSGDAAQEIAAATGGSFPAIRNPITVQEIGMTLPPSGNFEAGVFLNHLRFSDPSYGLFRMFTMGGSIERLVGGGGLGLRAGFARATGYYAGRNAVTVTELFIRTPLGVPGLAAMICLQNLISREGFYRTVRVGVTLHGGRSSSPARARGK